MRTLTLRSTLTSSFAKGASKLVGGQGVAMAIPILTAPILGRLYTPTDYGLLGVYMGIGAIFGLVGNWQYSQAIIVQKSERRAQGLVGVAAVATVATTVGSVFVSAAVALFFATNPALAGLVGWLWLIPIITFCVGIASALASIANRRRDYGLISIVTIASVIAPTALSVGLGYCGAGAAGLLASYVLGPVLSFALYAWAYRDVLQSTLMTHPLGLLALARRNISFPRFSLPASVMRSVALSGPGFALAYMGATDLAGHLTRAQSLLALPIGLIGMALAQVFQQRAVHDLAERGTCWPVYKKLFTWLALASPPSFLVLAILAPNIFVFYLGPRWADTGYIAQLLAPMVCLRMIYGPLWPIFSIYGANHQDFWIALAQVTATISIGFAIVVLAMPPIFQIFSYVAVNSVVWLALIIQSYRLARSKEKVKDSLI